MKFYSQLNTSGREPSPCDTPVSHSIDIPTEELKIVRSSECLLPLNSLVCDIKQWMAKKKLKLNEKKTECLIIGTKHDITKYDELKKVSTNNQGIALSRSVRDLGFVMDNNLTCNEQIQSDQKCKL